MDIMIQNFNRAISGSNNSFSSLEGAFNGKSILQNYIRARLTNRQTIRILLDQEQYEREKAAIAQQIADETISIVRSVFK